MDEVLGAFGDGPMIKRLNVAGHTMNDYDNFKSLILQMLEYDAKDRIGPLDALQHAFFRSEETSKNSTARTPTSATNMQSNREFQTIPLAAMLAERSQLERSTLERSQLERIASDDKEAYQYDLLNKYKLNFKSPGKQVQEFRYANQLRSSDEQQPFYLFSTQDDSAVDQSIAQQNILNRNNGERLVFNLSQPPQVQQHQNAFYSQQQAQNLLATSNSLYSTASAGEDTVDSKLFRKQYEPNSLIDFSNSIGSNLNLINCDSTVDLHSLPYSDALQYNNSNNNFNSSSTYKSGHLFNENYNDLIYDKHYPNYKSNRLNAHPPQTISSTISSLNLLDHHLHQPDRSMKHVQKALSSSIGNLNLLNNQHQIAYLNHPSKSAYIQDPYILDKTSKRKSYANEYWFK